MLIKDMSDEDKEKINTYKNLKCHIYEECIKCPIRVSPSKLINDHSDYTCLAIIMFDRKTLCLKEESIIDIDISKLE